MASAARSSGISVAHTQIHAAPAGGAGTRRASLVATTRGAPSSPRPSARRPAAASRSRTAAGARGPCQPMFTIAIM